MKAIRILLLSSAAVLVAAASAFLMGYPLLGTGCIAVIAVLFAVMWGKLKDTEDILNFLTKQTRPMQPVEPLSEESRKQRDLQMFIHQINPHFLYNTLEGIRGEALINDQPEIAQMTERLSRFFRYCISSRGDIVRLAEELRNVNDYFGIQKFRFGDRIELHVQIEDEELLQYYVPKLTIQPIIENAIVHGIEDHVGKGEVWLRIRASENNLYINIVDNGGGMDAEQLARLRAKLEQPMPPADSSGKHSGIAIHNVHSRIRLCFGPSYGLNYRSFPGDGTNVEIRMPLVDDFKRASLETKLRSL